MSLTIYEDRIEITVPNSEAAIIAQHIGIMDRTVSGYYCSEITDEVAKFLDMDHSLFYVDLLRTSKCANKIINFANDHHLESLFKSEFMDQYEALDDIDKMNDDLIRKIDPPFFNDKRKYLKFNNDNIGIQLLQVLLFGDLMILVIKKLANNCYIVYTKEDGCFEERILSKFQKEI